jgi:hypothetical protein
MPEVQRRVKAWHPLIHGRVAKETPASHPDAYPDQGGAAGIRMVLSSVGAVRHVLTWEWLRP